MAPPGSNDPNDWLQCSVCKDSYHMAEPNYVDPETGTPILCCWSCRSCYGWKIEAAKYVELHEWIRKEKEKLKSKKATSGVRIETSDWDDITPPGGFIVDPNFRK